MPLSLSVPRGMEPSTEEDNDVIALVGNEGADGRHIVETPAEMDIICGRGKNILTHPGNQRFRNLILARRDEYQRAEKRDTKSRITEEIANVLREGPEPSR